MTLEEQKQKLDAALFHLRKSGQSTYHLKNRLTELGLTDLVLQVKHSDMVLDAISKQVHERYVKVDREIREVSHR